MNYRRVASIRLVLLFLVTNGISACAGWHTVKGPPAEFIAREKPGSLRATTAESTVVIRRPFIRQDSIVGAWKGPGPALPVALRLSEIQKLETHALTGSRTGKIIVATFTATFLVIVIIAATDHTRLNIR
jgi:hypothetical protein